MTLSPTLRCPLLAILLLLSASHLATQASAQDGTAVVIVQNELNVAVTNVRVRLSRFLNPSNPFEFNVASSIAPGQQAELDVSRHHFRFIWAQLNHRVNGHNAQTGAFVVKAAPRQSGNRFILQVIFRVRSDDGSLNQAQIDEKVSHSRLEVGDATLAERALEKQLKGELRVAKPVWIYGPYPTSLHVCKPDDVYVLQIRYPIRPGSLPVHVDAYSNSGAAVPTDCVLSEGEVAKLSTVPQTGTGLGVGYLAVFVKAFHEGRSLITAEIQTDDSSVEKVTFALQVGADRNTLLNGAKANNNENNDRNHNNSNDDPKPTSKPAKLQNSTWNSRGDFGDGEDRPQGYIKLINETKDLSVVVLAVANVNHGEHFRVSRGAPQTINNLPPIGYGVIAFDTKGRALGAESFQLGVPFEVAVTGSKGNYKVEPRPLE